MPEEAQGNIYDLGYRGYEGPRLGRGHAIFTLYKSSLRSAFGLGRGFGAKFFPMGLTVLAFFPAVIQLAIAALAEGVVDLFEAASYYGYTQVILAIFCAAVAPELVGRDQRTNTLTLYFSRAFQRLDYAAAKYAALATALLALTLAPQVLLFIGNGFAGEDLPGYIRDEWTQVAPIVVSAVLLCAYIGGISLAIAAQTPRRAYSTVAILAAFMVTWIIGDILAHTVERAIALPFVLLAPFHVMRGFTLYLFGEDPGTNSGLAQLDVHGAIYLVTAIAFAAVTAALLYRRYRELAA